MKKHFLRFLPLLLLALICAFSQKTTVSAASTETLTFDGVEYIKGGEIQEGAQLPAGVSYDVSTSTMTLNNYTSTLGEREVIYYDGSSSFTLVLEGNNTIQQQHDYGHSLIFVDRDTDFFITGNGTLNLCSYIDTTTEIITARDVTIDIPKMTCRGYIHPAGELTIQNCDFEINASDSETDRYIGGMLIGTSLFIENSQVTVNTGTNDVGYSLNAGVVKITGSDVKISGKSIYILVDDELTLSADSSLEQQTDYDKMQYLIGTNNFNTAPEHHFYLKDVQIDGEWKEGTAWETSKANAYDMSGSTVYRNKSKYILITSQKQDGYDVVSKVKVDISDTSKGYLNLSCDAIQGWARTYDVYVGTIIFVEPHPLSGYKLKQIYVNGKPITGTSFEALSEDMLVTAEFTEDSSGGSSGYPDYEGGQSSTIPVTVSGISNKIAAGKSIKLTANQEVVWTSSNTNVATVSSSGVVRLNKKSGGKSVIITATARSGLKKTYKITSMKGIVKKVSISGNKSVKAGKTLKLKGKVTATSKANKKLKWSSSNTKYAVVSSTGKVATFLAGKGKKVRITAAATDGSNKKKTVTIKIK